MLGFDFYNKDKEVASFYVDEYDVFMIDGKYYTISSGSFDYEAVKCIYEEALRKDWIIGNFLLPARSIMD